MESKDEIKWHKKPSNIIIALFIFFPGESILCGKIKYGQRI